MRQFHFNQESQVARPLEEVFAFFADAQNLQAITPPWLNFGILTPQPIRMQVGTRIDYRLRIRGIPLRWQTEITAWNPPFGFVDEQKRGPYRLWVHRHTFKPHGGETLMRDEVTYAVLGGWLVDRLLVRADVQRIFDYRQSALQKHFQRSPR